MLPKSITQHNNRREFFEPGEQKEREREGTYGVKYFTRQHTIYVSLRVSSWKKELPAKHLCGNKFPV
jgi:hypothetical protein